MILKIQSLLGALLLMLMLIGGTQMLTAKTIYDFELKKINGSELKLEDFRGKVLLLVNTASKCGFTKQYDGLQELYMKYGEQGLVVIGFPANNFLKQEPGSNDEIESFCRLNFGVTFPLTEKISVRGKNIHPLYKYLTEKETDPEFHGKISWNFTKFLISREGRVIDRFAPATTPQDDKVIAAIEEALQ